MLSLSRLSVGLLLSASRSAIRCCAGTAPHVTKINRISDIQHLPAKKNIKISYPLPRLPLISSLSSFILTHRMATLDTLCRHCSRSAIQTSLIALAYSQRSLFTLHLNSCVCAHTLDKCQEKARFSDKSAGTFLSSRQEPLPLQRQKRSGPWRRRCTDRETQGKKKISDCLWIGIPARQVAETANPGADVFMLVR